MEETNFFHMLPLYSKSNKNMLFFRGSIAHSHFHHYPSIRPDMTEMFKIKA